MENKIPTNKLVNIIGKRLKKQIDSAYAFKITSNMCDVYFTVFYQAKNLGSAPGEYIYSDLHEMSFDINITTYQNKIRVNILEISPREQTVNHVVYDPARYKDQFELQNFILYDIELKIAKRYKEYEFLF